MLMSSASRSASHGRRADLGILAPTGGSTVSLSQAASVVVGMMVENSVVSKLAGVVDSVFSDRENSASDSSQWSVNR